MEVIGAVRQFLADDLRVANAQELPADLPLLQKGILDSLEVMRVASFLEKHFGIAVDETEVVPSNFRSLQTIQAFVERKRAAI